ncbi:hypothetical protein [Paraburkholderia sp. SIMBA_054]|uniref:hypothetical protein n=2 Tax=Burkholderiaceae TaxID=119060 RepID=UPI00397A454B
MPSAQDLFDQYLNAGTPASPAPVAPQGSLDPGESVVPSQQPTMQQNVAATADAKKAALAAVADQKKVGVAAQNGIPSLDQLYSDVLARQTGAGLKTMPSQVDADVASLPAADLIAKYGYDQGMHLVSARLQAQGSVQMDATRSRDYAQAIGDFGAGVGLGVANSVGGIGALGLGLINRDAGTQAASAVKALNDAVQGNLESDALQAHQRANAATNQLGYRDNVAKQAAEAKTDGNFVAGLRRIGRDATTAVGNAISDPTVASDGLAQGIGSLVTAGPIGKGIGLGAKAAIDGAEHLGLLGVGLKGEQVAARLAPLAHDVAMPGSIGLTEAGGAYQQTAADIMGKSDADMRKDSPTYVDMVDNQGMNPDQAKSLIANRAGMFAAAVQGPAAMMTGKLVEKFEAHPFSVPSLREAGQNILKEGLEETIQSGTGQLAQNMGTQKSGANPGQDLLEGVGEQAGLGGLYGMASAGAVQGPGAVLTHATRAAMNLGSAAATVARGAVNAAGAVAQPIVDLAAKRGDKVAAANEAASPVSDQNIATAADEIAQNAPAAAAQATQAVQTSNLPEAGKAKVSQYIQDLTDSISFHPDELQGMPQPIIDAVGDASTRVHALQNMDAYLNNPKNSEADKLQVHAALRGSLESALGGINESPEELAKLPENDPARQYASDILGVLQQYQQSPGARKAQVAAQKAAQKVEVPHVSEESAATPEGQQAIQTVANVAALAPDRVPAKSLETVMAMQVAGKVSLSNYQSAAIRSALAVLKGREAYVNQLKANGQTAAKDIVAEQVSTAKESPEGRESAAKHIENIRSAYASGDLNGAKAALEGFGKFAQSQQNKVRAINAQITAHGVKSNKSNSLQYDYISPDKSQWQTSKEGFGVTPTAAGSVDNAQTVGAEAHALTEMHNALASAYPELKVGHLDQVSLDPSLTGDTPAKVAQQWTQGKRTAGKVQGNVQTAAQTTTPDTTKTVAQAESKPVEAPVEAKQPEQKQTVTPEAPGTPEVKAAEPAVKEAAQPKETQPAPAAAEPEVKTEPVKEKKGVAAVYPDLVEPKSGNQFTNAFTQPKTEKSSLAGAATPVEQIKESLSSPEAFQRDGKGSPARLTEEVSKAYRMMLNLVPAMVDEINDHLQTFLAKSNQKGDKAGKTYAERFAAGEEINRFRSGKLMNLAEVQPDGSYKLNQSLAETAGIAGLQWFLSANTYGGVLDESDARQIFGLNDDVEVNPTLVTFLNSGVLRIDAISSLAQKVQNYWGLDTNRNAPDGYTKGIPQAMAAELLRTMMDTQLSVYDEETDGWKKGAMLTEYQLRVDTQTGNIVGGSAEGKSIKTLSVLVPAKARETSKLQKFPDAIERVVSKDPALNHYLDGERPAVPKTQMRNPLVENTAEQKDMITNETATPFKVNPHMAALYRALTVDKLVDIFGPGTVDEEKLNVNDANSKKGQRQAIVSAFNVFEDTLAAVEAHAEANSKSPEDVEIRYGYNMSRVSRLQMLGRFNPQASKLMREAVLPTQSTLNLGKREHMQAFMLGVGQAIGTKVHNMPFDMMLDKTLGDLTGKFAPAVDVLRQFQSTGRMTEDMASELKASLGSEPTFVQLHGLMEYARYLDASKADRKAFRTQLYLEADGMTNGPVNAMALLSQGRFTKNWVRNMARGGLWFGGTKDQTSTVYRQSDPIDLYKATSDDLRTRIADMRKSLPEDVKGQQNHLLNLMNLMLGDAVKFDGQDTVELDRGIAKNPLTITIYGSGAAGIAGKLTGMLVEKIYAQFSDALANGRDLKTLFGTGPEAESKRDTLIAGLDALIQQQVKTQQDGSREIKASGIESQTQSLKDWTFSGDELKAIRQNMLSLFVEPMRESIKEVVGPSLLGEGTGSADLIRKATQIPSIMQQYAYQRAVKAALEAKAKGPDYKAGEYLSQKEQDQILGSVAHLAPVIKAPGQAFYVAGSQDSVLDGKGYAEALDGTMQSQAVGYGPGNSGVAGIPFMNIGMGDGKMMQIISTMANAIGGTLKIFDGMNMPLDRITEGSQQANQAVYQSWMGNPLQAVSDAYSKFVKDVSLKDVEKDGEQHQDLVKALFGPFKTTQEFPLEEVRAAMLALRDQVAEGALQAEARHRALNRVNVSVDQMAAASAPYQIQGKEMVTGSEEEIATRLSELYAEERDKLQPESKPKTENIAPELQKAGVATDSGARILNFADLNNLVGQLKSKIPTAQGRILQQINKSLAAQGYKVIFGTQEQLLAYNSAQGGNGIDASWLTDARNKGFMLPGRQEIYLMNPTSETLTHELIHASTFETVLAHYAGDELGPQGTFIKGAIGNIEKLMTQFLSMGDRVKDAPPKLQQAYADAVAAINGHLNNADLDRASQKAQGLNEFMAWALANQDLARLQERTAAHPLVQLARDAVNRIKQLIWGRKEAPFGTPAEDMFSNLAFNTAILLQTQPSRSAVMRDTALFQSTAYGVNDRLSALDDTFDRKVADYLDVQDLREASRRQTKVSKALQLGTDVALHFAAAFPMTMQEKTTFGKIVSALATEAHLDGNVLTRMQQLWTHVEKNLTVEDLMDPNAADPQAERYYAQQKYDAILGNSLQKIDGAGRSSLLPAFMALAVTNDQFRDVLHGMDLPKGEKSGAESRLDALLENSANAVLDNLSRRISGDIGADSVREAMYALSDRLIDIAQDRQSFYDQLANPIGDVVDRSNDLVVQGMNDLAGKVVGKAEALDAKHDNRLTNLVASSARLMAAVVSEEHAGKIAEGVMTAINKVKGLKPFTEVISDLVGRTASNASVYDMIKIVRTMIAQDRQQFREEVPKVIASHFSRQLTEEEWSLLHRAMGKSDLASLAQGLSQDEIMKLVEHPADLKAKIQELEAAIQSADTPNWARYQNKMQQLAAYMMNGTTSSNLLRNAVAISRLLGEQGANRKSAKAIADMKTFQKNIDMLTTLYALNHLELKDQLAMSTFVSKEAEGLKFSLAYLQGQRVEEQNRAVQTERALFNHYKGNIPSLQKQGASLIVADDADYAELAAKSYVRVADYRGSSADTARVKRGYYFADVSGRNVFAQGILQNVRQTAGGVDIDSGYTISDTTAGRITDPAQVKKAAQVMQSGAEVAREHLLPVYDPSGQVVAFERSIDPFQQGRLSYNTHLAEMVGVWRGRQVEEAKAAIYNDALIDRLYDMYDQDMNQGAGNQARYVNVFDAREQAKDPVLADAAKLITPQMQQRIKQTFGERFYVRRDMLNDALGYRAASVGDAWTGTSRWSDQTQENFKRLAMSIFGNKAYQYTVNAEKTLQSFIGDVKTMIVVKSVVVPMTNMISNAYQLAARGVPVKAIITGMPKKTAEVRAYVESEVRRIAADAELRAAQGRGDVVAQRKLSAEIQSIKDSHKRMSIWPLIQAGEFSAISSGQAGIEDVELASGKLYSYIESLVNKLPDGVKTAGRYALITKDTALYRGMQTATEYGDFLAKAILYDDLTKRQGRSKEYALSRVTEEYVNYDRLRGRFRGYLESMGLLWFYNFKIRSTKVALSMIRNNPVHALLAAAAPAPTFLGSIGSPLTDNVFTKLADGQLNFSLGFGQVFHAPMLNPWVNLVH